MYKSVSDSIPAQSPVVDLSEPTKQLKLYPKQSMKIDNGKGKCYTVTAPAKGGRIYCTCDAWKYQKLPPSQRTCKHAQMFNDGWTSSMTE